VLDSVNRKRLLELVGTGIGDGAVLRLLAVDGPALCRMFNQAISGQGLPCRLSIDHDPLFEFERWQANLRTVYCVKTRVPVNYWGGAAFRVFNRCCVR